MDILQLIESNKGEFSKSEQKFINLVLAEPLDVLDMSISKVAKTVGKSTSIICRACKKLGLSGYPEFRIMLSQSVLVTYRLDMAKEFIDKSTIYLKSFLSTMPLYLPDQIDSILDILHSAPKILIMGSGEDSFVALELLNKLLILKKPIFYQTDMPFQNFTSMNMQKDEAAIAISFEKDHSEITSALCNAKNCGCRTIFIGRDDAKDIAEFADVFIGIPGSMDPNLNGFRLQAMMGMMVTDIIHCKLVPNTGNHHKYSFI